ncbi:DUF4347 domain-containing protein [Vicingaceae bacterium]|nr:DUF4347 domain-containing protein [Vicingaceae bacterium]
MAFVDRSVDGWRELLADLEQQRSGGRGLEVVLLDPARDGVDQITKTLARYSGLQSIHIVSHGKDGQVQLGGTLLDGNNLAGYTSELTSWGDGLNIDADILFYGCNLSASHAGKQLTESISALTGADVASSTDLTGSSVLGGDWDLEFQVGSIESDVVFSASLQSNWQYTLDVNIDQAWLSAQGPGPYYLDQQGETYILQTDVNTDGTAFAIIANDVTLDLNGHTVTYDDATPIPVFNGSFESGSGNAADGWDFSGASNAIRFNGEYLSNEIYDGDYSLTIDPGFTGEQTVFSTSTVTLEANTTYSLSGMFQNDGFVSGVSSFARLVGVDNADQYEASWTKKNSRGIQFVESVFTTGGTSETYRVFAGADNPDGDTDFRSHIDDIKIQRTLVYGVAVEISGGDLDEYAGVTQSGSGDRATIKNGSITQGQGNSTKSHAIFSKGSQTTISQNTITNAGTQSSAIHGRWNTQAVISDNTITSNVDTVVKRDNLFAVVVSGGQINGNTIIGGPQNGILTVGTTNSIYDNTISVRSKYTNGFGIMLWSDRGSEVYQNTIDLSQEDFGGRGIHVNRRNGHDPSSPTIVRDNVVTVREIARNQEYGGIVIGGAYGIQLEGSNDVEVYGNIVEAIADEGNASALRVNNFDSDHNVFIHDNVFKGTRLNDSVFARSMMLTNVDSTSGLTIENNTFSSNFSWLGGTNKIDGFVISSNVFDVEGDGTGFTPVQAVNYPSGGEERAIKGMKFVNNTYTSTLAHDLFVSSPIGNGGVPEFDEFSWIFHSFETTFVAKDLGGNLIANANVTVEDKDGNQVFSGATAADGSVTAILDEFKMHGDVKTDYNDYSVTVSALGTEETHTWTVDDSEVIDITINAGSSIDFNASSGIVTIKGSTNDDISDVTYGTGSQIDVTLTGVQTRQFDSGQVNGIVFYGYNGDDTFTNSTSIDSSAYGGSGSDRLNGGSGSDFLNGQSGYDKLFGNDGEDLIYGGNGDDYVHAGAHNDTIYGGGGNDLITGGLGGDQIHGEDGNDRLLGYFGNDRVNGGKGNDEIYGQDGDDRLYGDAGDDLLNGGAGDDYLHGGDMNDTILGGAGDDYANGAFGDDQILGGSGSDQIFGTSGNDRLYGDDGDDLLDGGAGDDYLKGGDLDDTLIGGEGDDFLTGALGDDLLFGGDGADLMYGYFGDDSLYGGAGVDLLNGGDGNDGLFGGGLVSADTLIGDLGYDRMLVQAGDVVQDKTAGDAKLVFVDQTSVWSDAEIEVLDGAFAMLHDRTNNARLLQDSVGGLALTFYKHDDLNGASGNNVLEWTSPTDYHREIQIADWDETSSSSNDAYSKVIIHEMAHNWDSDLEMTASQSLVGQWDQFIAISDWQDNDPGGYTQSTDGQWWYNSGASFADDYGKTNPFEDFATVFESYFSSGPSSPNNGLQLKLDAVDLLFDSLT